MLVCLANHAGPDSSRAPTPNGGLPGRERGSAERWTSTHETWLGEPDMRVGAPFGAVGWRTATIVVHTVEVAAVMEGRLPAGLPYLRLGQGPPLVMALGGVAEHANAVAAGRWVSLATAARFGEHFTVYVTSRKPGLAPGTTMADIAADYAAAIGEEFGGPVAFHGTSAGGAVGLQLAIGYPQLVRRLVLAAAACRQSPSGRHLLAEVARLAMARDSRRASALIAQALGPGSCVIRPTRWLGW